ncbi:MAG: hypothetical protein EPN41_05025 [Candidimonas sp.]|nr:MAG: hypothetical protein EPN41_05025 [Candidimonas sp.]
MAAELIEQSLADPGLLHGLFAPRSVAVVGASANPARFSGRVVPTLLRHGYTGDLYPVNPKRTEISGRRCYADLAAIPGDVDCVVYCFDAAHILDALSQCAKKRVKLLVIASTGFAESGTAEGRDLQAEVVRRARASGIRVLGPNCIGFANFGDSTVAAAAAVMEWRHAPRGHIGLVTQSGGLGLATVAYCAFEDGIGFSHIISTGNEADIDTVDVAEFFVRDAATHVIAITIEAVREPARFITLLEHAGATRKPVVVLKSGRSSLGKVMAASHTGALAGQAEVFEMVCRRYGVTVADDVDDFYQIAAMFGKLRAAGKLGRYLHPGSHCAALSLSGGHVGLFADLGSLAGLRFPPFDEQRRAAIAQALGFPGHFQNPLDTTARVIGDDAFWGRCVNVLMDDVQIELVVPIITVAHSYAPAIADFVHIAQEREKIVVVVWAGGSFEAGERARLSDSNVPFFRTPSRAARALQALERYCSVWNADVPPCRRNGVAAIAASAARQCLLRARREGRTVLAEYEAKKVLGAAGLPRMREFLAASLADARLAAAEIGYPVVLKGQSDKILHKTDAGIVFLDVPDEAALTTAFTIIQERVHARAGAADPAAVLIQEKVQVGQEMIVGAKTDPEFGAVVVVGIGGIFVEIAHDVALRLPPLSAEEAGTMLNELKGVRLLQGARGQPAADISELSRLIARFSEFVHENRDLIAEIDVNPLASVRGAGVWRILDALILLKPADESRVGQGSL